ERKERMARGLAGGRGGGAGDRRGARAVPESVEPAGARHLRRIRLDPRRDRHRGGGRAGRGAAVPVVRPRGRSLGRAGRDAVRDAGAGGELPVAGGSGRQIVAVSAADARRRLVRAGHGDAGLGQADRRALRRGARRGAGGGDLGAAGHHLAVRARARLGDRRLGLARRGAAARGLGRGRSAAAVPARDPGRTGPPGRAARRRGGVGAAARRADRPRGAPLRPLLVPRRERGVDQRRHRRARHPACAIRARPRARADGGTVAAHRLRPVAARRAARHGSADRSSQPAARGGGGGAGFCRGLRRAAARRGRAADVVRPSLPRRVDERGGPGSAALLRRAAVWAARLRRAVRDGAHGGAARHRSGHRRLRTVARRDGRLRGSAGHRLRRARDHRGAISGAARAGAGDGASCVRSDL
ncbi:MAG: hypothetical protein AVDCRST_MAG39-2375, partial [uncultured Sphingomonadaceae bacterium]